MWVSYFNWFMAFIAIGLWIYTFTYMERFKIYDWFDNKFGKDDPMPTAADMEKIDKND